ncbi:hypothetical protein, partial [Stenotrophomonas maltophilia]|uniref:hypothetical protein n=2 Tax=Lysobacteraceae TaxID=32033 RepID=UPI001E43C6C5
SNRRHGDFQSPALPTELLGHVVHCSEVAAKDAHITEVSRLRQAFWQKTFTLPSAQTQVLDPPSRGRGALDADSSVRGGAVIIACGGIQRATVIDKRGVARPARGRHRYRTWNAVFVTPMGERCGVVSAFLS